MIIIIFFSIAFISKTISTKWNYVDDCKFVLLYVCVRDIPICCRNTHSNTLTHTHYHRHSENVKEM